MKQIQTNKISAKYKVIDVKFMTNLDKFEKCMMGSSEIVYLSQE
jgi:hypothetical protein